MISFFKLTVYTPLYNFLIFIVSVFPWLDKGFVIILFTLIIRVILFPLSLKAVRTQIQMREITPEIEKVKEKYKENKQDQARAIMDLYKEKKVSPFSSLFLVLIQTPIVISVYYLFRNGFVVDPNLLYSFVSAPEIVNTMFLGLIDISQKSIFLALAAAITSFFQVRLSMPPMPQSKERTFKNELAKSMNVQMKYVFPIILFFISYALPGAVALYLATSNMFVIGQELYVRKKYKNK